MPIEKRDSYITGTNDYKDTANSDIVVITAGYPTQARHEPRRLAQHELQHHEGCSRRSGKAFAELHPDHRFESARRHGASRLQAQRIPPRARSRHGWSARFRPLPRLHRRRIKSQRRERHRIRPRRPRRYHGSAPALFHGRRNSDHGVDREIPPRSPGRNAPATAAPKS